jgi:thioredoxin 1
MKIKEAMKKHIGSLTILLLLLFSNCNAVNPDSKTNNNLIYLTNDSFKKLVFNYTVNKEWKYEGSKPCIIDFYADWCGPCRALSPIIEEVSKEYADKIIVYKVNTDKEQELSASLGITSLPTLLLCPQTGKPQASMGLISKETLVKAIKEVLLKQ